MDSPSVPGTGRTVLGASLTTPQQPPSLRPDNPPNVSPPIQQSKFKIGELVEVAARTWPGINKHGGLGRVTKIHQEGDCYDVAYILGGSERKVEQKFIRTGTLDTGPRTLKERDFFFNYTQSKSKTPASSARKKQDYTRGSAKSSNEQDDDENCRGAESGRKRTRRSRQVQDEDADSDSSDMEREDEDDDVENEDETSETLRRPAQHKNRGNRIESLQRQRLNFSRDDETENIPEEDDAVTRSRRKIQEDYARKRQEASQQPNERQSESDQSRPSSSPIERLEVSLATLPHDSVELDVQPEIMPTRSVSHESDDSIMPASVENTHVVVVNCIDLTLTKSENVSPSELLEEPTAEEPGAPNEVSAEDNGQMEIATGPFPPKCVSIDRSALRAFAATWKLELNSLSTPTSVVHDFFGKQRLAREQLEATFRTEVDRLYDGYLTSLQKSVGILPRCSALVASWRRLDAGLLPAIKRRDEDILSIGEGKRVQETIDAFSRLRDAVLARQVATANSLRSVQREEFKHRYSLYPSDELVPLAKVVFPYDMEKFQVSQ